MALKRSSDNEPPKLIIIRDTREQRMLDAELDELDKDLVALGGVSVKVQTYWPGDYSLRGYARMLAVERKSVSDLVGTMIGKSGRNRNLRSYVGPAATSPGRFDKTLLGLCGVRWLGGFAAVLVEPDKGWRGTAEEEIDAKGYRSETNPRFVRAFIRKIREFYRIPVILTDSRAHSARIIASAARLVKSIGKPTGRQIGEFRELLGLGEEPEEAGSEYFDEDPF